MKSLLSLVLLCVAFAASADEVIQPAGESIASIEILKIQNDFITFNTCNSDGTSCQALTRLKFNLTDLVAAMSDTHMWNVETRVGSLSDWATVAGACGLGATLGSIPGCIIGGMGGIAIVDFDQVAYKTLMSGDALVYQYLEGYKGGDAELVSSGASQDDINSVKVALLDFAKHNRTSISLISK